MGFVCQYLQQSHFKVTVDAFHVAQDPLPVRAACSQHLLYSLWSEDFKEVYVLKNDMECVFRDFTANLFVLFIKRHQGLPEFVQSQHSLLF